MTQEDIMRTLKNAAEGIAFTIVSSAVVAILVLFFGGYV